jgi:hypothetical protein
MMKVNPDYVTIGILVPFPGTEVVDMAKRRVGGLRLLSTNWQDYTKQSGDALYLESLNSKELKFLQTKAYAKFYLRPSRIFHLLELASLKGILNIVHDRIRNIFK